MFRKLAIVHSLARNFVNPPLVKDIFTKPNRGLKWGMGALAISAAAVYAEYEHGLLEDAVRVARTVVVGMAIIADYKLSFIGVDEKQDVAQYKAVQNAANLRTANRFVYLAKANGGVYVKAGQYLASLSNVLPEQFTSVLSVLQDRVNHLPFTTIMKEVEREIGCPLSERFMEFSHEPIAAASLAQVHTAKLTDGTDVVVKVQYPRSQQRFYSDVWVTGRIVDLVALAFSDFKMQWLVPQFRKLVDDELDFELEAHNNRRVSQIFAGDSRIAMPTIYWSLTTKRLLTMERMDGVKITDAEGIKRLGGDPRRAARLVVELFSEMMFLHGFVHADPHPGNIFFRVHNGVQQIVLLDHGLYISMAEDFRKAYADMWYSAVVRDTERMAKSMVKCGVPNIVDETGSTLSFAALLSIMLTQRFPKQAAQMSRQEMMEGGERIVESLDAEALKEFEKARALVKQQNIRQLMMQVASQLPIELRVLMKINNLVRAIVDELAPDDQVDRLAVSIETAIRAVPDAGFKGVVATTVLQLRSLWLPLLQWQSSIITALLWLGLAIIAHGVGSNLWH
eukprot:TRINITY_DN8980_c0_g1_i3.p1 TRINITY_DN8980_c0_g1~~TRINITY_DN8980_c0_g1_i3.p1  ORF type:complete len:565 (-),score=125.23 TRINITY_DN8980_c0_g1_i3:134-1828(-)